MLSTASPTVSVLPRAAAGAELVEVAGAELVEVAGGLDVLVEHPARSAAVVAAIR
jgi:hypothetical protein